MPDSIKTPKDHYGKKPSPTEMIDLLIRHMNRLYSAMEDVNARLIAVTRSKLDPSTMAKLLLDKEANGNFMEELNKEIDIELKKRLDKVESESLTNAKQVAETFAPPKDL